MPSKKKKDDPPWFHPSPEDVLYADDVFGADKLTNIALNKIKDAIIKKKNPTRPKGARQTWQDVVTVEGQMYGASCKIEDGKIVVTGIKGLKGKKTVARKRSMK